MASQEQLCLYFGSAGINLAIIRNRRLNLYYFTPYEANASGSAAAGNVAEEVKLTATLQKALRDNKIEAQEALVALPTKDFIIRSFVMPQLPKEEVHAVVEFEIRKYIPFKLEELFFDYQLFSALEGKVKKYRVLFIGIKRTIFEKYIYVLEQAGMKIRCIEPHAISLIRILLSKKMLLSGQSTIAVETNLGEGTIIIAEQGNPYLIRDFTLSAGSEHFASEADYDFTQLVSEIRVSLEYYRRQNAKGNIGRLFFFSSGEMKKCAEDLGREFKVGSVHYSHQDITGIKEPVDYGLLFAYGVGLVNYVRLPFTINLARKRFKQEITAPKEIVEKRVTLPVILKAVAGGLVLMALVASLNLIRISGAQANLNRLKRVNAGLSNLSEEEINKMTAIYENKISTLEEAFSRNDVHTVLLSLPLLLPDSVWLTGLSMHMENPNSKILTFRGIAYSGDANVELDLINRFISVLRQAPEIKQEFKTVSLVNASASRGEQGGTSFEIACR